MPLLLNFFGVRNQDPIGAIEIVQKRQRLTRAVP